MSKYCSNCGAKVIEEASFCGECGEKLIFKKIINNVCFNCGCSLKNADKYCPECGTHIPDKSNISKNLEVKNEKSTISEKRKVIATKKTEPIKKKKRSFLGCLGKSLLAIFLILVIGIVIIWNFPGDDLDTTIDTTNIPGIVDVEDDVSNYETLDKVNSSEKTIQNAVVESNNLSQIVKSVESVFENADTIGLKQILSSTSLKMYKGSFLEIQPYMKEYAKAFKSRKLVHSSKIYALYSFKDKEGNEYTTEFANDGSGTWKLIHF
jgi:uncharacterized Zn finger protein (UPF0148 family)